MHTLIEGSLTSVDQLIEFIEELDNTDYQRIASPQYESSIGQHLRHILDLYQAVISAGEGGLIDYDQRRRGNSVERDVNQGLAELADIRQWLTTLNGDDFDHPVSVSSEININTQQVSVFQSSYGRELCFVSSHLTHHLAIMAAIAKFLGKTIDAEVGLAPSTASFFRQQSQRVCAP